MVVFLIVIGLLLILTGLWFCIRRSAQMEKMEQQKERKSRIKNRH